MNAGMMGTSMVQVHTTSGRGLSPEEHAQRCADKIVAVADSAPPEIRQQAYAYKTQVTSVVARCMREAIASDRTTVYNALIAAGHPELANAIRRL
jgi:hypothetical protein